jgi:phytoene desaturase (3,4-didehydrolycopene-forming)
MTATAFSPQQLSQPALSNGDIHQVVIVGGGVGGLSIASRIKASLGDKVKVTILERNERIGGRCGSFTVTIPKSDSSRNSKNHGGSETDDDDNKMLSFRHEHGPSLLLLPQIYEELFLDCNTTAQACGLNWIRCAPAYQCVFDDGDCISIGYPEGNNQFVKEIQESRDKMDTWEADGSKQWDAYMQACEAYLDCGLPNFIEGRLDLKSFPSFLREALRDFGKAWPLRPHSDVLDSFFQSDKMKAMASFQDLYVGLEPFRNAKQAFGGILHSTAPAVFGLLSAIELHPTNTKCGVFAPTGGFQAVTDAFENLAQRMDVRIECNRTVAKVTEDGVYYCDTDDPQVTHQFMAADLVVINADLPYAAKCLAGDNDTTNFPRYDWIEKSGERDLLFSSGVIAFHWCIDKELSDLSTHNVFLMASGRDEAHASWKVLRDKQAAFSGNSSFNFYVHRAGCSDATAAPQVCQHFNFVSMVGSLFVGLTHIFVFRVRTVIRSWFWFRARFSSANKSIRIFPEMRRSLITNNR